MLDIDFAAERRHALRERLLALRSPEAQNLYAVLDLARDPYLFAAMLEGFDAERRCLFRGRAKEELGDRTAWIARIDPEQGLLDWLLEEGWGRRAFSLMTSPLTIHRFVSHVRKFTKVRDDAGEEHFFRFYDPQVLRQYLPVFGPGEHAMFFRSIACCAIEDTRFPGSLLIARSVDGSVAWNRWDTGGASAPRTGAMNSTEADAGAVYAA